MWCSEQIEEPESGRKAMLHLAVLFLLNTPIRLTTTRKVYDTEIFTSSQTIENEGGKLDRVSLWSSAWCAPSGIRAGNSNANEKAGLEGSAVLYWGSIGVLEANRKTFYSENSCTKDLVSHFLEYWVKAVLSRQNLPHVCSPGTKTPGSFGIVERRYLISLRFQSATSSHLRFKK